MRISDWSSDVCSSDLDRWTLVAADLCRSAVSTGELVLRSTGQQWRDFIGLADVVRAIAASTDPAKVPAGTYNLASGTSTTVRELAELVQDRVEARTGKRRSEEHTSELQSLMRISYAVFCLKKKKNKQIQTNERQTTQA